jgi:23S rRNA (cytosine1962-C5)-methyltransferase
VSENLASCILRGGRDKSVRLKHPWIFASAISAIEGSPSDGDTILVRTSEGEPLGRAAYSGASQIRARMWTWDAEEEVDEQFLFTKINSSIEKRKKFVISANADSYRLIFGESDGIPGLIVDQYKASLVIQILSGGVEQRKELICEMLNSIFPGNRIYERSDVDVRALEGLQSRVGLIHGEALPATNWIQEYGIKYLLDIKHGQKTGFYLDQRENRHKVGQYCLDKDVLNCFSYSGGFTLNALKGGAQKVTSIDSSQSALDLMDINIRKNQINPEKSTSICGDVFKELRYMRDKAQFFDVIILDPPKFAPTTSQAEKAARGYKDINLLALKLLRPGGVLFTFSCSGGISRDLFQKIVTGAALDAGADIQIIDVLSQAADHPVLLSFPESMYLKGLVCVK